MKTRTILLLTAVGLVTACTVVTVATAPSPEQRAAKAAATAAAAPAIAPVVEAPAVAVVVPTGAPAAPAVVPTAAPEPIRLQGRGQTATQPVTPPGALSVATFTHAGARNFIVKTFRGGKEELLINRVGTYQGQRPVAGGESVTFDIQADGEWTLLLEPIKSSGTPPLSGKGDTVGAFFTPAAGAAQPWEFMHDGQRNFIVTAHCRSGNALVQNKVGAMQGSGVVRFGAGPCFWEVQADGAWSLTPRP